MKKLKKLLIFLAMLLVFPSSLVFAADSFSAKSSEYNSIVSQYSQNRNNYLSVFNRYKSLCKKETDECKVIKEDLLLKIKSHLTTSVGTLVSYIEMLKARVSESNLGDVDKASNISTLDLLLKDFSAKKDAIKSLADTGQVAAFSSEIRSLWREKEVVLTKMRANIYLLELVSNKIRLEKLIVDFEKYLSDNSDKYKDATVKSQLEGVKVSLAGVSSEVEKVKVLINSISVDNVSSYKEIKIKIKDISKSLKAAIGDLKSIFLDIKDGKVNSKSTATGIIYIKGEGSVVLSGSFKVDGVLGDDKYAGSLTTGSADSVNIYDEGLREKKSDDTFFYSGLKKILADVKSKTTLSSSFIDVKITGSGVLNISGDGLYKISDNGTWTDVPQAGIDLSI